MNRQSFPTFSTPFLCSIYSENIFVVNVFRLLPNSIVSSVAMRRPLLSPGWCYCEPRRQLLSIVYCRRTTVTAIVPIWPGASRHNPNIVTRINFGIMIFKSWDLCHKSVLQNLDLLLFISLGKSWPGVTFFPHLSRLCSVSKIHIRIRKQDISHFVFCIFSP